MSPKIPNGYYLIARKLFESPIWRDDPHILKLFIYLIGEARHLKKPKRYPHCLLKCGELVTSLSDIAEANEYLKRGRIAKWSRQKVSRMLNHLEKQGYISILADTYGTHISICNYDYYQDCNNYKADRSGTEVERKCYGSVTGVDINNNDKNVKNVKNEKPKTYSPDFLLFWNAYPRKKNKGTAEKAFSKIKPNAELLEIMIAKIEELKKTEDWTKDNGKYIPYPSSWINARGWEDEIKEDINQWDEMRKKYGN